MDTEKDKKATMVQLPVEGRAAQDALRRKQTPEEKAALQERVKASFKRYDQAFRNLAK